MMKNLTRRKFVRNTVIGAAGAGLLSSPFRLSALSPNESVNIAIIGLGGRAYALAQSISLCDNLNLSHVSEVDGNRATRFLEHCDREFGFKPNLNPDFRTILDDQDVDAIAIATPEHWHAPMAIMGLQAGKHVYVEKPCSHNPHETELLVQAAAQAGTLCQMGNQQRSSITSNEAIDLIRGGEIGDVYYGKAWYSNKRGPIGFGKKVEVPEYLNWDLWQGPAPREGYRDNVHPYNWHWFRTWGTGEIHNNGTHEIDICRWAMNVQYPERVVSTGGRLHYEDDWQWFDTQVANFEFEGGRTIIWEGTSCNNIPQFGRGRGSIVYGTEGSAILDRQGYVFMNLDGKETKKAIEPDPGTSASTSDTSGFDGLTIRHLRNFTNAIRLGDKLNAPIADGAVSTQLCHLGNIAQDLSANLNVDSGTGKVINNPDATARWKRSYEPGWEPKL